MAGAVREPRVRLAAAVLALGLVVPLPAAAAQQGPDDRPAASNASERSRARSADDRRDDRGADHRHGDRQADRQEDRDRRADGPRAHRRASSRWSNGDAAAHRDGGGQDRSHHATARDDGRSGGFRTASSTDTEASGPPTDDDDTDRSRSQADTQRSTQHAHGSPRPLRGRRATSGPAVRGLGEMRGRALPGRVPASAGRAGAPSSADRDAPGDGGTIGDAPEPLLPLRTGTDAPVAPADDAPAPLAPAPPTDADPDVSALVPSAVLAPDVSSGDAAGVEAATNGATELAAPAPPVITGPTTAGGRPPASAVEALARRVVVPVGLLVAALVYLLVQARLDRGATLLTAPPAPGGERDDEVFPL